MKYLLSFLLMWLIATMVLENHAYADDNYIYYTVSDMLDIADYYREYKEKGVEDASQLSNSLLEYEVITDAGVGRRFPIFSRVLLRTDETGELKQYIVYLSMLADKDDFNCDTIMDVYDNQFMPLKPDFYINNCSQSSLNFYRSHNYSYEY